MTAGTDNQPRYTTARMRLEIERAKEAERERIIQLIHDEGFRPADTIEAAIRRGATA